ncbi:MAG TPA: DUF4271 domain-containing protein [Puia sp.]|nr:DUF4271 domain-containing protein [Puia sp.]
MIRFLFLFLMLILFLDYSFAQTNADSSINKKDSLAQIDSVKKDTSNISKDGSTIHQTDSVIFKAPEIPGSFYLSMKTLADNPYFNFLGKRQMQLMPEHKSSSKDYLFYLMLLLLLYFGLIKVLFEKYLNSLFQLFFRASLRKQQLREQLLQTPLPSLLLNVLFIVSAGLYASFLIRQYRVLQQIEFPLLFAICSASLTVLYAVKFALLKLAGWIFNRTNATDAYIFIVFLVNKMMGILLLPFSVIMSFSTSENLNEVATTISLIMIGILFIYRFITGYRNIRHEIKLSVFHFFIYLCAFEITPVLLIYKVLLAYLEKAS